MAKVLELQLQQQSFQSISKIGRNINNLRYVDDITLMAESEEELRSLLMRMKVENEKADFKFNI